MNQPCLLDREKNQAGQTGEDRFKFGHLPE